MKPFRALVLVAGVGSRLHPLTMGMPKCLASVHGRTILSNALDCLWRAGASSATLVTGHLADRIEEAVGRRFGQLEIDYVRNPDYARSGTAHSLRLALQAHGGCPCDLVVVEGDVFFEFRLLFDFLRQRREPAMAVTPYHPSLEGSLVSVGGDGRITSCTHLSARPPGFEPAGKFKTVNLTFLPRRFAAEVVLPSLDEFLEREGFAAPLEDFIQRALLAAGRSIRAWTTAGHRWWEIDDHDDLAIASRIFAEGTPA